MKIRISKKIPLLTTICITMLVTVFGFQQCSDVELSRMTFSSEFASKGFPFRLYPPTEYMANRRYVILVDMTNSMISGPCPFDVGNSPTFHADSLFYEGDPNKESIYAEYDVNDGRGVGRDCYVDPSLGYEPGELPLEYIYPWQYTTHQGSDHRAYRLELIEQWFDKLRGSLSVESLARTKILLIPVSGGRNQAKIEDGSPAGREFLSINDPRLQETVTYFRDEHLRNLDLVKDVARRDRWLDTNFGTTAPGQLLTDLHALIDEDMDQLNRAGQLNFATYDVIYLGDGAVTPTRKHLDDVMAINRHCNGQTTDVFCSDLVNLLKTDWGDPSINTRDALDLQLAMIQALPQFYGSGLVNVSFLRVHPEELVDPLAEPTTFDDLVEMAKLRFSRIEKWDVGYGGVSPSILPVGDSVKTYKMTHLYVYNPNVRVDKSGIQRVDSDGDGVFDEDEAGFSLDPLNKRTNGFCMDSFLALASFRDRCEVFAQGNSCDPSLDTDVDGLNQCEEIILGTDPFDFDTDGDSIPDSLEWIYGFNPLKADREEDTSGDGIPNLVNFSAGLGSKHFFERIPSEYLSKYSVDFQGYEVIDDPDLISVQIEKFDVRLQNIPVKPIGVIAVSQRIPTFLGRISGDGSNKESLRIPASYDLLGSSDQEGINKITALARIIDPRFPKMVYWRIMRFGVSSEFAWSEKQVDLSAFELLPMIDKNLSAESSE